MIIWPSYLTLSSSSAWSVLQSISFFNNISVPEFFERYYDIRTASSQTSRLDTRLDCLDWLADHSWQGKDVEPSLGSKRLWEVLRNRTAASLLGINAVCVPQLRSCPVCMGLGQHSVVHQLDNVVCCFIHGCPLISGCPACGKKVNYSASQEYGAYTCGDCHGFPEDSMPQWCQSTEFHDRQGLAFVRMWLFRPHNDEAQRVLGLPVPVSPQIDQTMTGQHLSGWLAWMRMASPSHYVARALGEVPSGMSIQEYSSCQGELLRVTDVAGSASELAFDLQDEVDAVARKHLLCFATSHPCLLKAHTDFSVSTRAAGARVIGRRAGCAVGRAYYTWLRTGSQLIEDIDAQGRVYGGNGVEGDIDTLITALKSRLHLLTYHMMMQDRRSASRAKGRKDLSVIPRLSRDWFLRDSSRDVPKTPHIAPALDYSEWIADEPCARV